MVWTQFWHEHAGFILFFQKNIDFISILGKNFLNSSCGKGKSMVDFVSKLRYDINDLKKLMSLLRSEQGCAWDREQTHKSIRGNLIEEANEAANAIDEENTEELLEELGDVLMQVVFHADIANDDDNFNFDDVVNATCKKLIRRHPHVFGNMIAITGEEAISFWEDIKHIEKDIKKQGHRISDISLDELEKLYRESKLEK